MVEKGSTSFNNQSDADGDDSAPSQNDADMSDLLMIAAALFAVLAVLAVLTATKAHPGFGLLIAVATIAGTTGSALGLAGISLWIARYRR